MILSAYNSVWASKSKALFGNLNGMHKTVVTFGVPLCNPFRVRGLGVLVTQGGAALTLG